MWRRDQRGRTPVLSRASVVRITLDLLADELAASRGSRASSSDPSTWDEATRLDVDGLDLDSLERLDASAALNEFFHLHEFGAEDHLLAARRIGDWCDIIDQSLATTGTHLTFRTSGSTGEPKRCTHAVADLMVEVDAWAAMLAHAPGVVGLIPAHHIYGTVFTALLPDRLGVPCVSRQPSGAGVVSRALPGSVIVGTPTRWAYLSRSLLSFPPGLTGISSTAPLSAQLAHRLRGQRLDRLVEIYGSSETGGIAYRTDPVAPFALLDHWRCDKPCTLVRRGTDGGRIAHELPDRADWLDNRLFALDGRRDGAVQIGGYNVYPDRIRDRLLAHAGVADAAVRLEPGSGRLKAFIVPVDAQNHAQHEGLIDDLDGWCGAQLRDHERPRRFTVGTALPRSAMGKPADW